MIYMPRILLVIVLLSLSTAGVPWAADPQPTKPTKHDKCPVCGMFVAKYPDFLAQVIFKDGSHAFFDGVKDMMKFYLNLPKYRPEKQQTDVAAIFVTDYYSLDWTDGLKCYYVLDSDVYGPMGRELIPFAKKSEADQFMTDHKGRALLTFEAIDATHVKSLD